MKALKIHFDHGVYETSATITSLEELEAVIDDWSTDHCEGSMQGYIFYDGAKKFVPFNIYCEEVK